MNTKEVADLLGVVPNTVRRLAAEFHPFLSGGAHPPKGKTRIFDGHDLRVLHYVQAEREIGNPYETIHAHLKAMQSDNWDELPPVPPEWQSPQATVPIAQAASRAYDMATLAAMQRDLEYAQKALSTAQQRVEDLETENARLVASQSATASELHDLQIELERARGEVQTLTARLDAYTLAYGVGRDRPLPLAAIILVTALVVLVAVLVVFVAARLLVGG